MLEQCWADDGTYTDPLMHLPGRDALSQPIANFHQRRPGESIVLTGGVDHHHKHLHFTWLWFAADGTTVIGEGVDFAELADDGKLGRIIGFFGTLPPLQSA